MSGTTQHAARDWSQPVLAGVVTALVGYVGSFAVVLTGLRAVGADTARAASGLLVLSLGMGALTLWFSVRTRMPVIIAWSTPGAALLASTGRVPGGYAAALGAFAVTGTLIVITGAVPQLSRWVSAVPPQIAAALLAGVLLPLCAAPVNAMAHIPWQAAPVVVTWAVFSRLLPRWAVPAALAAAAAVVAVVGPSGGFRAPGLLPPLTFDLPRPTLGVLVGLALPLYVITMASQNIPGIAVLATYGYRPPVRRILTVTGAAGLAVAPSGGIALNLSSITAAMAAGPDAHPDPRRRWIAGVASGCGYLVLGLCSGLAAALGAAASPLLIETVAGLALLGALVSALTAALAEERLRECATVTFLVTVSNVTVAGISSPFWGLLAGFAFLALRHRRIPSATTSALPRQRPADAPQGTDETKRTEQAEQAAASPQTGR